MVDNENSTASLHDPASLRMKDIAAMAGTSLTAVSAALSGSNRVSAATRKRIQALCRQVGYRPKASARALARGRTHTVGVLFADSMAEPAFCLAEYAEVVRTITILLAERNYFVSLAAWTDSNRMPTQSDQALPRMLKESGIEAALAVQTPTGPLLEQVLQEQGLPCVMIDAAQAPGRVAVAVDECRAAELAVKHLVDLGHQRIVYAPVSKIAEPGPYAVPRQVGFPRGYARAMSAAGLVPYPGWDDPLITRYEKFFEELFSASKPPTALIVYDNEVAVRVISWLTSRNINVPKDVSVVALSSLGVVADRFQKGIGFIMGMGPDRGITCIRSMQQEMATAAVEKLMQLIGNPNKTVESVLLEPEIVPRGSSGPCIGSQI